MDDEDNLSTSERSVKSAGGEAVNRQSKGDSLRPSMQQSDHPEHNMPTPEHDGVTIKANDGGAPQ